MKCLYLYYQITFNNLIINEIFLLFIHYKYQFNENLNGILEPMRILFSKLISTIFHFDKKIFQKLLLVVLTIVVLQL